MYVMDGSVMPANPCVNPSPMITALRRAGDVVLAEQGRRRYEAVARLHSDRLALVMPNKPILPKGAPGEPRLDGKKDDVTRSTPSSRVELSMQTSPSATPARRFALPLRAYIAINAGGRLTSPGGQDGRPEGPPVAQKSSCPRRRRSG
jgi:hypothetical protein